MGVGVRRRGALRSVNMWHSRNKIRHRCNIYAANISTTLICCFCFAAVNYRDCSRVLCLTRVFKGVLVPVYCAHFSWHDTVHGADMFLAFFKIIDIVSYVPTVFNCIAFLYIYIENFFYLSS